MGKLILVACEESQTVCKAFRKLGFEAYSNDLLDCSGGHPEWHLKMDCFDAIKLKPWDLMIAHPECTRLTLAANKYYKPEYAERFPTIHEDRVRAIEFFMRLVEAPIRHKAIENPIGIMSTRYRKPDQIIQPYYFGDTERKGTCLWLYDLPKLTPTNIVKPDLVYYKNGGTDSRLHYESFKLPKEERRKLRSKTFEGIANAMAEQWGSYLNGLEQAEQGGEKIKTTCNNVSDETDTQKLNLPHVIKPFCTFDTESHIFCSRYHDCKYCDMQPKQVQNDL